MLELRIKRRCDYIKSHNKINWSKDPMFLGSGTSFWIFFWSSGHLSEVVSKKLWGQDSDLIVLRTEWEVGNCRCEMWAMQDRSHFVVQEEGLSEQGLELRCDLLGSALWRKKLDWSMLNHYSKREEGIS